MMTGSASKPLRSYAQVEVEMRKLSQVYAVYSEHADAVRGYAGTLWSELDVGKMMAGTEVGLPCIHHNVCCCHVSTANARTKRWRSAPRVVFGSKACGAPSQAAPDLYYC